MKLLVCTDGSEFADKALRFSAELAKNYKADLTVLHVVKHEVRADRILEDEYGKVSRKVKEILRKAKETLSEKAADTKVTDRFAVGPVSREIVRIAEEERFDMIVMGTRGLTGLKRMLLGSVADAVARYAHCPVTIVR